MKMIQILANSMFIGKAEGPIHVTPLVLSALHAPSVSEGRALCSAELDPQRTPLQTPSHSQASC